MRVSVFVPQYPSLSETWVSDHLRSLFRMGYDVELFRLFGTGPGPDDLARVHPRTLVADRENGRSLLCDLGSLAAGLMCPTSFVKAIRRRSQFSGPSLALTSAIAAAKLSRQHGRARCDIAHVHHGPMAQVALHLRHMGLLECPLIVSFHGTDVRVIGTRNPHAYREVFEHASCLIANTQFLASSLRDIGAPPEKIVVHPVGVRACEFPFRTRSHPSSRPLRLLSVGRLTTLKGIRYALHALAGLVEQGVDANYTIVGEGPLRSELEEMAGALGVGGRAVFVGGCPFSRVVGEMDKADLLLHPGIVAPDGGVEAQGRVLIEAQAMGLPVIASCVGGIPEAVCPEAGILHEPKSPHAIAEAVTAMLAAPSSRWSRMSVGGRTFVEEHYDLERLDQRLQSLYETVLQGGRPS